MSVATSNTSSSPSILPANTCTNTKIFSSIAAALGAIIALAGVLTLLAVAYPHSLGPLNALATLTNIGGVILIVTGCAILAVALAYLCKKTAHAELFKREIDQLATQIKRELKDQGTANLQPLHACISKHYQNPQAMQYLVRKFSDHAPLLTSLVYENLGGDAETHEGKFNKAILDAIRSQPALCRQVIENCFKYSIENKKHFPWDLLDHLNDTEVALLTEQVYAVNGQHLMSSFTKHLKFLIFLNHKSELDEASQQNIWIAREDIQKLYQLFDQKWPKSEIAPTFAEAIKCCAINMELYPDSQTNPDWLKQDFASMFS